MITPQGPTDRIAAFVEWLQGYGDALESTDLAALDRLFAVEATYRPTPFAPVLRGRRAIREHLRGLVESRPSMANTARALGVGSTYAVAHWVSAWHTDGRDQVEDGILLAAFDRFGRCTSLRAWPIAGEGGGREP